MVLVLLIFDFSDVVVNSALIINAVLPPSLGIYQ